MHACPFKFNSKEKHSSYIYMCIACCVCMYLLFSSSFLYTYTHTHTHIHPTLHNWFLYLQLLSSPRTPPPWLWVSGGQYLPGEAEDIHSPLQKLSLALYLGDMRSVSLFQLLAFQTLWPPHNHHLVFLYNFSSAFLKIILIKWKF